MPSTVPNGNYNACMVIGKGNPTPYEARRVAAVETTVKMTDPQIAAKGRAHFANPVK